MVCIYSHICRRDRISPACTCQQQSANISLKWTLLILKGSQEGTYGFISDCEICKILARDPILIHLLVRDIPGL